MRSGLQQGSITRRMIGFTWLQRAPFRSISGPPQGSGRGRVQELIWVVLGAHLGLPGRSFVGELELIFPNSELRCCSRHREVHGKSENVTL